MLTRHACIGVAYAQRRTVAWVSKPAAEMAALFVLAASIWLVEEVSKRRALGYRKSRRVPTVEYPRSISLGHRRPGSNARTCPTLGCLN